MKTVILIMATVYVIAYLSISFLFWDICFIKEIPIREGFRIIFFIWFLMFTGIGIIISCNINSKTKKK